jgi:hypothetical protein
MASADDNAAQLPADPGFLIPPSRVVTRGAFRSIPCREGLQVCNYAYHTQRQLQQSFQSKVNHVDINLILVDNSTCSIVFWPSRGSMIKTGVALLTYKSTKQFRTKVQGHTSTALPSGIKPTTQCVVGCCCSTNLTNNLSKSTAYTMCYTVYQSDNVDIIPIKF